MEPAPITSKWAYDALWRRIAPDLERGRPLADLVRALPADVAPEGDRTRLYHAMARRARRETKRREARP